MLVGTKDSSTKISPEAYVKGNMTLSYSAYFEDQTAYSDLEMDAVKIRKCLINFYVENSSLSVFEKSKMNSGLMSGKIVRKAVLRKPSGEMYTPHDFRVGSSVMIYGRTYTIQDCDLITRRYLKDTYDIDEMPAMAAPQVCYSHNVIIYNTTCMSG